MDTHPDNPPANALPGGVTDAAVQQGIDASGYPLQLVVAQELSADFSLQEEWGFVDPDTGTTRAIDLVASKRLFEWREPQPRVRPALNFVIECKQSELPYVFFLSKTEPWLRDFPIVSGLKTNDVTITSDDDPSSWQFDPISLFGLNEHTFLKGSAPSCMTFSKCVRKGSNLQLSGSDSYQTVVYPIMKGVSHFHKTQTPPDTAYYFDCELTIGLAVLDAPMVGVRLTDSGTETELLPWVRVSRHQPSKAAHKNERSKVFGIDVVHRDYLRTYLDEHVKPFADEFSKLVLKHPDVLAEARGFVPGMGENSWTEIESRLRPATITSSAKRGSATLRRIAGLFKGKARD